MLTFEILALMADRADFELTVGGQFVLKDGELNFEANSEGNLHSYGIVYVFLNSNDEALYVGRSNNRRGLMGLIYEYRKPGMSQMTRKRIHPKICEVLASGETVKVVAFVQPKVVDPTTGRLEPYWNQLESNLINNYEIKWNMSR